MVSKDYKKILFGVVIGLIIGLLAGNIYGGLPIAGLSEEITTLKTENSQLQNQISILQEERNSLQDQLDNFLSGQLVNLPQLVAYAQDNLQNNTKNVYVDSIVNVDFRHYHQCNFINSTIIFEYGIFGMTENVFDDNCKFKAKPGSPASTLLKFDNWLREALGAPLEKVIGD